MREAVIRLTEQEEALCQLLDQTCDYIHTSRPEISEIDSTQFSGDGSERCEARIAGGWVRDKLLARESDDLDISLSTLTGNAFALYLKHYLTSPTFTSTPLASSPFFQDERSEMGRIGKIAANPEQSKNLETATARVLGLSLDFVNLRKESYDPGSRIPTMTFGTPKEDAERRDITINSMLYNVHTRRVEDHTGMGLQDLAAGLIRTPLPPLTTFLDDPLRVLRCVRFASRFAYELHPTIIRCLTGRSPAGVSEAELDQAAASLASSDDPRVSSGQQGIEAGRDEIRNALLSKVSRERFGIEVDKMIKGPNPLLALFLIHRLELFPLIFHPPPGIKVVADTPASSSPTATMPDQPGPNAVALNGARLLDAILKRQPTEDAAYHVQPVAMDTLSINASSSDSEQAKQVTRAFSALPASPIPQAVFDALPRDLLDSWSGVQLSPEERRRLWMTVALLPLRGLVYEEKKNKMAWAGEVVVSSGLKLGTKTLKEPVASLNRCIDLIKAGRRIPLSRSNDGQTADVESDVDRLLGLPGAEAGLSVRSRLALLLRNSHVSNSMLQLRPEPALLISFIAELLDVWQHSTGSHSNPNLNSGGGDLEDTLATAGVQESVLRLCYEYSEFWRAVVEWDLVGRAEEKPILDGNAVTSTLQCHPKLISVIQTRVLAWQFDRPAATEASRVELEESCKAWLKAEWENGGIVPPDQRPPPPPGKADKAKKKPAATTQPQLDRRKRQKSE
ncbi:hypothetical protein BCV70DRAFT_203050 [Testicularia cyperi]|uniref:Poly A polymerase head domain-containing protein n=1 Tax=Testicularia cyperi TaxID=1882483 RepID=A0A317XFR1_9BASI|nr:hypothetical protein BCV70DRAFT_203050 [Testicularia cyperi]